MNQSGNAGLQSLLFNNQSFMAGLEAIQNDPQFSSFRNDPDFMQMLNMMQNNSGTTADIMRRFAQIFPAIAQNSLRRAGVMMESVYTQSKSQNISNESSNINDLQYQEIQLNKEIETQETLYKRYKESRKKLIDKNDSFMKELGQDPQNIEGVPSEAKKFLNELEQLNNNIDNKQHEYAEAKDNAARINCLKSLIELKKQKIKCLGLIIEVYKDTGKNLYEVNELLKESIDAKMSEQKDNMESSSQANIKLMSSTETSKSSLFEKMAAVATKNESENDTKPNMQQNNENLKQD